MRSCQRPMFQMVMICLVWISTAEAQWGTIKGQIVVEGDVPRRPNFVVGVPGIRNVPDESVVIDSETKGLANVVLFLSKTPAQIHPELVQSKEPEVAFDIRGARFVPHVLLVRTDQKVRVRSADPFVYNVHTYPIKNAQENFQVQPNDRQGVLVPSVTKAERLPAKVGCDIHPWMQSWWMILDHPYAAVTNSKGEFEIKNLPVGEHSFRIWQEKAGYLDKDCQIIVKEGDNALPSLVYPASLFK